jgi:hypothetical protein
VQQDEAVELSWYASAAIIGKIQRCKSIRSRALEMP